MRAAQVSLVHFMLGCSGMTSRDLFCMRCAADCKNIPENLCTVIL